MHTRVNGYNEMEATIDRQDQNIEQLLSDDIFSSGGSGSLGFTENPQQQRIGEIRDEQTDGYSPDQSGGL